MEFIEVIKALSKFGITGVTLGVICYVVWLDNKKEKGRMELRTEEMKQSKKNSYDLVNELKNVAHEVGESTKTVIKLVTSNDVNSKYHNDSMDRFETQIVSLHERINNINANATETNMIAKDIKNAIEKCHK